MKCEDGSNREFIKDKLTVKVMPTRTEMGQVAAQDIHDRILALLAEKDDINLEVLYRARANKGRGRDADADVGHRREVPGDDSSPQR